MGDLKPDPQYMQSKLNEWSHRVNFPVKARARLGFAAEYWRSDPKLYEGYEQLDQGLRALGRKPRKSYLAYELSSHLLRDVLVAAGGVEDAVMRLRAAIVELRSWVDAEKIQAEPGVPYALSHSAATTAWYAFSDVLTWSRTVVERMERQPGNRKRFPKQGLLPALKPKRLKRTCEKLFGVLKASPVGQSRALANFVLHTALVQHPHTGVELEPSGAITLPIPDLPSQHVAHWYLLSWQRKSDGLALAERMWNAIQTFVESLIAAFEAAVPRRMRKL